MAKKDKDKSKSQDRENLDPRVKGDMAFGLECIRGRLVELEAITYSACKAIRK